METIRVYVLPLVLGLTAAILLATETRALQIGLETGKARWIRFVRRALGSLTIATIGFMLHFAGRVPGQEAREVVIEGQFRYWLWILALVCAAVAIALWDACESIRTLKQHLDRVERDELASLQEAVRKRR